MASTDAPVDRVNYFIGKLDLESLKFIPETKGIIDYSGHYYAQESILDAKDDLYLMAWIPGWDREWLPTYMNEPLKNSSPLWNGCFAIPRKLSIGTEGHLIQQPVLAMEQLRRQNYIVESRDLPVTSAFTAVDVLEEISGNQLEINIKLDLNAASFCGLNVLCDKKGNGGLFIIWSGDVVNVDGIKVPVKNWQKGEPIQMQIFLDKKIVEVFINGGRYCVTRQVQEKNIRGDHVALTRLGGTAKLISLEAWRLDSVK
jgi:beta-fructofuranosidase